MKLLLVRKIDDDFFAVKFNNDDSSVIKYFADFAQLLGRIKNKKFDPKTGEWLLDKNGYNVFEILDRHIFKNYISAPITFEKIQPKIIENYQDIGDEMKLPLYDYQKQVVKFCLDKLNALVVMPCGSGKSPLIIATYLESIKRKIISGCGLIVVKASLKTQWFMEIKKFSNLRPKIIQTYATFKDDSDFYAQFTNSDLMILSYETLRDTKVRAEIHKIKPQFVASDESHLIKNAKTQRAKALYEFSDAKIKIGATATPVQRDPRDIFGLFKFIKPELFESSRKFDSLFVRFIGRGIVGGVRNEELLKNKISPYMIVKTKEEVSKQLPKVVVIERHCELEPEQIAMTEILKSEIEEFTRKKIKLEKTLSESELKINQEYKKIDAAILARQSFAQEIADSEKLLKMSDSRLAKKYLTKIKRDNKLELLMDLIEEVVSSGEKIIIFSRFARMQEVIINKINELAKKNLLFRFEIARVHGGMNDKTRYEEVYTKFQKNDDYKILLMSDAGAEGFNASKCKYLCEYEPAVSYAIQTQRRGRIERADSKFENVIIYQLIANNSWDEIAQKIVAKKEKYDIELINGSSD